MMKSNKNLSEYPNFDFSGAFNCLFCSWQFWLQTSM